MAVMEEFVQAAIAEARISLEEGGIPVGSVLVHDGNIIGRGHNRRIQNSSAILHAEMDALDNAGRQPAAVYRNSTLFTTLSPCPMCAGAIRLYRIPAVVIGENRNYHGDEENLEIHGVHLTVLQDPSCIDLMHAFIEAHPELWNEDIGRLD
jgi:cytosine deaminase